MGPIYGALDLGTNNCRLLLAAPGAGGFAVVDAFSRIVRLGEGLTRSGALDGRAMDRTIAALRVCANKLTWHKTARRRLVATEACRIARNGGEFIDRVERETGLKLEVIDRETEAHLAAKGAAPLVEAEAERALVFDIGGGSTELMSLLRKGEELSVSTWISLPAGVVTLSENFGGIDVTPRAFAAMRETLRPSLSAFKSRLGAAPHEQLVGTSGTVTTIAGVNLGLKRYDRSRVDGCWLEAEAIGRVTDDLLAMSYQDRALHPCIGRERADLVLAGCAILEEVRATFPAPRIRVADRGLREGILTMMMQEDGVYGRPS
jgi:exopolyphosphatase/guanosine-5'-triphosphate,3'-diphosphate pyrophosphatase